MNSDSIFERHVADILEMLKGSYRYTVDGTSRNYIQIHVIEERTRRKIDFVNDIAVRYGEITDHPVYGRLDSLINILANKITALHHYEAKDAADIWILSKNMHFTWADMLHKDRGKEAGIDTVLASEIIGTVPLDVIERVKWASPVDCRLIKADLDIIAREILEGAQNSLAGDT